MKRWPIALQFFDTADGAGAGAPAVEAPPQSAPPADDGGSLADHEAEFVAPPTPEAGEDAADRRADGTFKPKHRAASQKASAGDVPRIAELTKKWRETETERDAVKAERDAAARERDELKARLERPAEPVPAAAVPAKPAAVAEKFTFPNWEKFTDANPNATYDEWELERFAAYDAWKEQRNGEAISARVAQELHAERVRQTMDEAIDQSRTKGRAAYPDFDDVLKSGPGASVHLHATDETKAGQRVAAIFRHPQSEHLQYAIMKDGDLAKRLGAMDDIAFGMELASLVASQRPISPARSAAAPTGSAPATDRPHVPRPPNPVRTGAMHAADEQPGDDASLSEHERFYVKPTRH